MGTNNGDIGSNFIEYCQGLGVHHDIRKFFFYSLQNMGDCPICNYTIYHMLISLLICTKDPQDAYFIDVTEPRFRLTYTL